MQPTAVTSGQTDLIMLGRWEWVTLPGLTTTPLRARVDTGARRSSIHADILETADGHVTFALPCGSITTRNILGEKLVRSSNGTSQRRIVVAIPTTVAGVTVHARYTLADRSAMRYPVLLGRNILSGRFLVNPQKLKLHRPDQPEQGPEQAGDLP